MKIQPNYIRPNYSQPAFKASFDLQDEETKTELKRALRTSNGPDYIYSLMENLKKIKSDDVLSIQSDWDFYGNAIIIRNERTHAFTKYYRHQDESNFVDYYNSRGYKISGSGAEVLYKTIMNKNSLERLFGRNTIAQSGNFVNPTEALKGKVKGTEGIEADILSLKKKISSTESQISDLNRQIQTYNNKLNDKQELLRNAKTKYVQSQIDI